MTVKCQSTWKEKSEKDGVAEEDDKLQEMWRGKEMEQFVFENEKKKYISKTSTCSPSCETRSAC